MKNVYPEDNASSCGIARVSGNRDVVGVARERLRLDVGEWVTVVGWLEGDVRKFRKEVGDWFDSWSRRLGSRQLQDLNVVDFGRYATPLPVGLEAILITQSRPPPPDAIYRGELPSMQREEM